MKSLYLILAFLFFIAGCASIGRFVQPYGNEAWFVLGIICFLATGIAAASAK